MDFGFSNLDSSHTPSIHKGVPRILRARVCVCACVYTKTGIQGVEGRGNHIGPVLLKMLHLLLYSMTMSKL